LLGRHEVFQVLVVRDYLDRVRGSFEFRSPFLECLNYGPAEGLAAAVGTPAAQPL
jgi:hypothetical protein